VDGWPDRHGAWWRLEAGLEVVDGVEEVGGPGPGSIQAEAAGAGIGGDVQEPVADGLGVARRRAGRSHRR